MACFSSGFLSINCTSRIDKDKKLLAECLLSTQKNIKKLRLFSSHTLLGNNGIRDYS